MTSPWTLLALSNLDSEIGTWQITVKVTLASYPTISATTLISNAKVLDPCVGSNILAASVSTPLTYQIVFSALPATITTFPYHRDTTGNVFTNVTYCGPKVYTTGYPWLTVLVANPPDSAPA
jgi:hypothetical protein